MFGHSMLYFVSLLTNKGEEEAKLLLFPSLQSFLSSPPHPTQPSPAQANIDIDLSSGEYYKKT